MFSIYKYIIPPSPLGDLDVISGPALFHDGEIGDLGEEEDPGEAKLILLPMADERLLLLLPLLRLSSLEVLSTERLTNGPFVLKYAPGPF